MNRRHRWFALSLTLRSALLFALLAALVVSAVGLYLYSDMARALRQQAGYQTSGRVEYFRHLLGGRFPLARLSENPRLFENMLGNENDILIFQRPDQPPLINVNPRRYVLPAVTPVATSAPLTLSTVHDAATPEGVPIRYVTAQAAVAGQGAVTITAGHVMTNETRMLARYRQRIILAVASAFALLALLGYGVMRHGLAPLRRMAAQAEEIHPATLTTRLSEQDAPAELHQVIRSFNQMLDRLADGYQRLSRFSADLAHEIRTPVNALMGHCQVTLYQRRSVEDYESVLACNTEELERISLMVENILFLARAGQAQSVVKPVALSLDAELQRIADYFEGLAEERGLTLHASGSGQICADAMLLRHALSNLVDNAIRYAHAGGEIRLRGLRQGRGWRIDVVNQGEPVAARHLDKLFDRFYRADDARTSSGNASGLGLSIVKAIMTLHQGEARVQCAPGGEICFSLFFPDRPPTG